MKLTTNFTLEEFENSDVAKSKKIDNTIPYFLIEYVQLLSNQLQTIRDAWNAPIVISSGYRCEKLNKAVGGANNSDHRYACAADIHTKENTKQKNKELFNLIVSLAKLGKIHLRQIIDERNYTWIHISVNNEFNGHRDNQILHL